MMETIFFKELFTYNAHYNEQLAEVLASNANLEEGEAHRLFSHVLAAHHIWNHRMRKQDSEYGVWEMLPFHQLNEINKENFEDSLVILGGVPLDGLITYKNSRGQAFENKINDILFHIINHSTYHRGQIARVFRENGLEPLVTDYIFWKR